MCHSRESGNPLFSVVTFFLCKKKVTKEKAPVQSIDIGDTFVKRHG